MYLSIANTPSIIIYLAAIALNVLNDPVFVNAIYAGNWVSDFRISRLVFRPWAEEKPDPPVSNYFAFSGITYNLGVMSILDPRQNVGFANLVLYISLFSLACSAVSAHRIAGVSLATLPIIHPFCGLWFCRIVF